METKNETCGISVCKTNGGTLNCIGEGCQWGEKPKEVTIPSWAKRMPAVIDLRAKSEAPSSKEESQEELLEKARVLLKSEQTEQWRNSTNGFMSDPDKLGRLPSILNEAVCALMVKFVESLTLSRKAQPSVSPDLEKYHDD